MASEGTAKVRAPKTKTHGKAPMAKAKGKDPKAMAKDKAPKKAKANGKASKKAKAKPRSGTGVMELLQRLRERAEKAEAALEQRIPEPELITFSKVVAFLEQLSRHDMRFVIRRLKHALRDE